MGNTILPCSSTMRTRISPYCSCSSAGQRQDLLKEQAEAVIAERAVDAVHPLHLAVAFGECAVFLLVHVDAITAMVFGHITGRVGGTQDVHDAAAVGGNRHDTETRADLEDLVFPGERNFFTTSRSISAVSLASSIGQCSSSMPNSSPPRRARVSVSAHARLQVCRQLLEQFIAGDMPAGVVHDLELVEIQIAERVLGVAAARALDRLFQPDLKLAAVDKAGQPDQAGLPGHLPRHIAQGGDIVQHQHRTDHCIGVVTDRRGRDFD